MAHPQSPHRPTSVDVSGGLGTISPPKDAFRMPNTLYSQVPLSSASSGPSSIPTAMATTFPDSTPSKEHQQLHSSLMGFNDPSALRWPANYEMPASQLSHSPVGYPVSSQYPSESTSLFDYTPNGLPDYTPNGLPDYTPNGLPDYTPNGLPYSSNYTLSYPNLPLDQSCPRSYVNGLGRGGPMSNMHMADSYPPSAYVIEPPKSHDGADLPDQSTSNQLLQLNREYENHYASNIKVEETTAYSSPYGSAPSTRCSTPHDDLHTMTPRDKNECNDDGAIDKEQPYAQLIHRALMEAPNHTMILRDIYQWFKENTDKAADKETKGWQNSIRHNLSMNGAFEKVDQPCEDARKGFMWRLSDSAIREGVKSTTRYRSKQPNKRGHRSQHPLPQRQASGAKGGQAARRAAKMRQSRRANEAYAHRSDPYVCRSVPATYDHSHFDPCTDLQSSYPASPFYGSEVDFGQPSSQEDFGASLLGRPIEMHGYPSSPLSQESLCGDAVYVLPHDSTDPLFYNTDDSPSPSVSEPLTPDSQGDCYMEAAPPMEPAAFWDDITSDYRE